jgi:NAD(P)-dependent dehydrogenase (short-subunit alcohol dehydrogenase family)
VIESSAGRAIVTGAARGIGAAIAARLASDGYEVIRLDREPADGCVVCDISDTDSVNAAAAAAGPVDVLVNNAGMWLFDRLEDVTPADFAAVLDVNVRGTFHCTQAFGRSMVAQGSGSIVNIASIAARHANPAVGAYGASKAAVVSLTEQTALEWGPKGVRCNGVGPGLIPTPGTGSVYDDPKVREIRSGAVPSRRLGTPDDIAAVVSFLCSPDAAYVNGQIIYVDGGLSKAMMTLLPRPADIAQPDSS